jgi:hypothetical protein
MNSEDDDFNIVGNEIFASFSPWASWLGDGNPFAPTAIPQLSTEAGGTAPLGDPGSFVPVTSGGITINLIYDAAALAAPASFRAGIQQAVAILAAAISDKITVNIKIDYSGTGRGAAAGPDNGRYEPYSWVRDNLINNATPGDTTFNALNAGSTIQGQSNVAVWNAQLKLWGVIGANDTTTDDGAATFATDIDPNLLVGVALHELTHAMGRIPYGASSQPDIFDFFRFTSPGTRLFLGGATAPAAYFSLDGGNTKVGDYGRTSDASDFLNSGVQGPNDPFNEFYTGSTSQQLTAADLKQLNALGFHTMGAANTGSVSINDVAITEGNSGTHLATFTVTRTSGTAAFAVNFATSDGTATTADNDYLANAGTLNFAAGVNTQTISVAIVGDTKFESDESFFVNLSGATNGASIGGNLGIGTVLNDDPVPAPSVAINDVTVTESNDGTKVATFTVTHSGALAAFSVNFATSDGSATIADHDYVASSGALNFAAGVNTQTISVPIIGDTKIESNETFSVTLSGATNGVTITDNLGIGTIVDDDGNHARDFNADARSDILWQRADGQAAEWQMDSLITAGSALIGPNPGPSMHAIATGDFNGDGHADILWQGTNGTPAIWLMNGMNIINDGVLSRNPGPNMHAIATGDFNGDGRADILWQGTDGTPAIWLMNGMNIINDGVLSRNPGPNMHEIATGDFNGDGYADILWQGTDGTPAIWLMKGLDIINDGVLSRNPGPSMHAIATGDFNGDGYADILWQGTNGTPAIWLMKGMNIVDEGVLGRNPGPTMHAVATGDFNNDHHSDILWHDDNGTPAMWLMNGLGIVNDGVLGFNPGADWHIIA